MKRDLQDDLQELPAWDRFLVLIYVIKVLIRSWWREICVRWVRLLFLFLR